MKTSTKILTLNLFLLSTLSSFAEDGAAIFKTKCTACHSIGKGVVVGPDLKDVHNRYDEKWLGEWIHSSQGMVKKNDAKAVELFKKFNQIPMPDQDINEADLSSLLAFIKTESEKPAAAPITTTDNTKIPPASNLDEYKQPIDPENFFFILTVSFITLCVVGIIYVLTRVIVKLSHSLEEAYSEINSLKKRKLVAEEVSILQD